MNLYEISVVDGKGITHKSKIYEINVDAAFKEAFIQGKIYGAEKLDDCTVQQIQTNAGVSKDTEREYLGRIKNILDALGRNSYCAMAFEGCVGDAEEDIDNDFAVSMKGRWESEKKAHEETREGLIGKLNDRIKRVAELEAEHLAKSIRLLSEGDDYVAWAGEVANYATTLNQLAEVLTALRKVARDSEILMEREEKA